MHIKNCKRKNIFILCYIVVIVVIVVILLTTIIVNRENIVKGIKNLLKLEIKEITYEVYSNQNGKIKLTLTVTDTENPIQEIALPDGDKLISTSSKNKIAIDYVIENDGTYTFTSKSATGETMIETINVDENFRNNLIGIDKIQGISTEEDYKITKKYDGESSYKYYYAIGENNDNWVEIPDYQIVNVDEYKIKENSWADAEGKTILKVKKVSENGKNVVEIHKKIETLTLEDDLYNDTEQTLEGDSIIACIRDNDIKSGNYRLKVNGEEYPAEIYNYNENVSYITEKNIGTSEEDSRMLIIKYNGNLNIDTDRLITAQTRKKGMFIYVAGELTNNGNISMTARGAKAEGQDVYLWKHDNGVYEYVPAVGTVGGKKTSVGTNKGATSFKNGNSGENASYRQTAGGGSGYSYASGWYHVNYIAEASSYSGDGTKGTSYSGGTGGGSGYSLLDNSSLGYSFGRNGSSGEENGQTGGTGYYGGTGNPGGTGIEKVNNGTSGTGGLLILYADSLNNNGKITSKGTDSNGYGGASGGGSVNIFYNKLKNRGNVEVNGGAGNNGGNGGDGSVTVQDINIKSPTIEATEITGNSFRINIGNPNKMDEDSVMYDYYIDGEKKGDSTTDLSKTIDSLNFNTTYRIKVVLNFGEYRISSNEIIVKTYQEPEKPTVKIERISEDATYPILTDKGIWPFKLNEKINIEISNEDTSLKNYYSIDGGKKWIEYKEKTELTLTGELLKVKSINDLGISTDEITFTEMTFKNIKSKEDALSPEAYDGDMTTYSPGGNMKNVYVDVDKSLWGKTININYLSGYHIIEIFDSSGNRIYSDWDTARNPQVTVQIPNNAAKIRFYFNEGGGIYEINLVN